MMSSARPGTSERELLVLLAQIIPAVELTIELLYPEDKTALSTMRLIATEVGKGLSHSGIQAAVDGVMQPFLRKYADKWDAFQRSSLVEPPKMATIWEAIAKDPLSPVQAFMQLSRQPAATVSNATQVSALEARIKAMEGKRTSTPTNSTGGGRKQGGGEVSRRVAAFNGSQCGFCTPGRGCAIAPVGQPCEVARACGP